MSELQGLQSRINDFRASGFEVIAISPDTPQENSRVARRLKLDYPILSDGDLAVTRALGLVHEKGGMGGHDVPRPATFLIENGVILWQDLTDNWRVRIHADDLLEVVRRQASLKGA
ncbi:MAG: redoxin domain-containing protein [bacterium]|nr:redoxin domain-containing protein [Gammaproteobacteria bacterium]HIL97021.1 redoxin domain-containing protein [Pseudomonadales bacterium]